MYISYESSSIQVYIIIINALSINNNFKLLNKINKW